MPVFLSPGVHYLEAWSEAVCARGLGRARRTPGREAASRARPRALAGLPAVVRADDATAARRRGWQRRRTILRPRSPWSAAMSTTRTSPRYRWAGSRRRRSRVHQVVCSPFRNPLGPAERRVVAVTKTPGSRRGRGRACAACRGTSALRAVALPGGPDVRQLDRGDRAGRAVGGRDDLPRRARTPTARSSRCTPGCSPTARERPLRSARNRPPAEAVSALRGRLACSTTAPRRSAQPPNAIAQSANQAHPSVSPATTSDTQCRSSSTRLQATATASPTATPTRSARARATVAGRRAAPAPRTARPPSTSARSGTRGRGVAASGSMVGRDRSTMPLMVLVANESPSVTASRNTGIQRFGTRIHSTTPTMTAITITPRVDARLVTASRTRRVASPRVVVRPAGGARVQIRKRLAVVDQHHQQRDHHAGQAQHAHRQRRGPGRSAPPCRGGCARIG